MAFFFFFLGTVPAAVSKVSRVATSSVIRVLTANSDQPFTQIFFHQITESIKHGKLCLFFFFPSSGSIVYSPYQTTVLRDRNENFSLTQVVYIKCVW